MVTNGSHGLLTIDRRTLLKCGLSASLLTCLPLTGCSVEQDLSAELMRQVSDSDSVLNPDVTGQLSNAEFAALFSLCRFVDRAWSFEADLSGYKQVLRSDLDLKTGQRPSYLTEYQGAADLIDRVRQNSSSEDEAWLTLLFSAADSTGFEATRLGRARRWVFEEIVAHQIPVSGAFKKFGFVNYRGYFGGSFASPNSYRRAEL